MKIHSITDLITNSSTTIYTYSEGSDQALKDLMNEVLKLMGSDKTCDDIFNVVVLYENYYDYVNAMERNEDFIPDGWDPEEIDLDEEVEKVYHAVCSGSQIKPEWMINIERIYLEEYTEVKPPTSLFIVPKSPKYEDLGKKALKFLNSTHQEPVYDG